MFHKIIKNFLICTFIVFAFCLGIFINILNNQVIDFSILDNKYSKPAILLDDKGNEWARFELDKRGYTKFEKFPKHLIQAFITAEDREFFNHCGLSYKGIIRSLLVNIKHAKKIQGASTITQQLVRLLFFDSKKTFKRKIKEQFFALLVEKQFSKEQILELYLNHIYFGCGIYGVEAASQRFFDKSVSEISVSQAALLASVVKSPAKYCPLLSLQSSKDRRNLILKIMHELQFLDENQFDEQLNSEVILSNSSTVQIAPHLKESIRLFLEDKFGKQKLYNSGLIIQTTINSKLQTIAEFEFKKQFKILKQTLTKDVEGAYICIDSKTGEIKAIIGGYDFNTSKYNRALLAKRQMGSTFKPIIYASAMQNGVSLTDVEIDEPIEIEFGKFKWRPNNNTLKFYGQMTLARALSFSNNTIAVKTLLKAGLDNVVNLARKFKFSSYINPYPSIALGCVDVTLKECVSAFNVFANNGMYVEPHFIKWVKDEYGNKIFKNEIVCEQIVEPTIAQQLAQVLSYGIKRYVEKTNSKDLECESIGKTGTTNKSRTCWFSGATPELTTSMYLGCDDNSSLGDNIYAVKTIFPIWLNIHHKIQNKIKSFTFDQRLISRQIDWVTGEPCFDEADSNCIRILTNAD